MDDEGRGGGGFEKPTVRDAPRPLSRGAAPSFGLRSDGNGAERVKAVDRPVESNPSVGEAGEGTGRAFYPASSAVARFSTWAGLAGAGWARCQPVGAW